MFVSLAILLFHGIVPPYVTEQINQNEFLKKVDWVLGLVLSFWLAFALYSIVDWTIKLFEGYYFPGPVSALLKKLQYKQHDKELENAHTYQNISQGKKPPLASNAEMNRLRNIVLSDLQDLEIRTPFDKENLLPTRLGNILRASELYPYERYKLEGITFWPRLSKVLPDRFVHELEEKNNQLVFMLNSSMLSFFLAFLCIGVAIFRSVTFYFLSISNGISLWMPKSFYYNGSSSLSLRAYLILGFVFLVIGYKIYTFSINVAEDYAVIIRSGYDLYRFEILKQLKIKVPDSLKTEKQVWQNLSVFFIAGKRWGFDTGDFVYELKSNSKASKKKKTGKRKKKT
jgi:hypothetical protein